MNKDWVSFTGHHAKAENSQASSEEPGWGPQVSSGKWQVHLRSREVTLVSPFSSQAHLSDSKVCLAWVARAWGDGSARSPTRTQPGPVLLQGHTHRHMFMPWGSCASALWTCVAIGHCVLCPCGSGPSPGPAPRSAPCPPTCHRQRPTVGLWVQSF